MRRRRFSQRIVWNPLISRESFSQRSIDNRRRSFIIVISSSEQIVYNYLLILDIITECLTNNNIYFFMRTFTLTGGLVCHLNISSIQTVGTTGPNRRRIERAGAPEARPRRGVTDFILYGFVVVVVVDLSMAVYTRVRARMYVYTYMCTAKSKPSSFVNYCLLCLGTLNLWTNTESIVDVYCLCA